jgi:hypothetical protein
MVHLSTYRVTSLGLALLIIQGTDGIFESIFFPCLCNLYVTKVASTFFAYRQSGESPRRCHAPLSQPRPAWTNDYRGCIADRPYTPAILTITSMTIQNVSDVRCDIDRLSVLERSNSKLLESAGTRCVSPLTLCLRTASVKHTCDNGSPGRSNLVRVTTCAPST